MLLPRQDSGNSTSPSTSDGDSRGSGITGEIVVAAIVAVVAVLIILAYLLLRALRRRNYSPKYIPTQYLKRRWQAWTPTTFFPSKGSYSSSLQSSTNPQDRNAQSLDHASVEQPTTETTELAARHTSVRSVMTLPAYSRSVRENERILAREGERDGIDVVIEGPENEAEEEARREAEMESLYQIRVQRRQEIEEREERARRRREARQRGDQEELERIRQERVAATERRQREGAAAMIAEHQLAASTREARASSVVYADIGLARHDGTRIRANSAESQRPLLDSAASIHGGGGGSLRPMSTRDTYSTHHANVSRGSFLSAMSATNNGNRSNEDFEDVPMHSEPLPQGRSRASTQLSTVWTPGGTDDISGGTSRSNSNTSNGAGEEGLIPNNPPSYDYGQHLQNQLGEEAPPYSSPVEPRSATQIWRQDDGEAEQSERPEERPAPMTTTTSGAPVLPTIERSATIRLGLMDESERT